MGEPLDVAFIAGVDENGGVEAVAAPMGAVDEVPLLESVVALRIEGEVVECLSEEASLVELVRTAILGPEYLLRLDQGRREGGKDGFGLWGGEEEQPYVEEQTGAEEYW